MPGREIDGLYWLERTQQIHLPFKQFPRQRPIDPFENEESWNQYPWNPPPGAQFADPAASPKPTWAELTRAGWDSFFGRYANVSGSGINAELNYAISLHTLDIIKHPETNEMVPIDGDISHLSSIIHLSSRSTRSGDEWPFAILGYGGRTIDHVWTPSEADNLLEPVILRQNRLESAGNIVRKKFGDIVKIIQDPNGGLDESATDQEKLDARIAASRRAEVFANEISTRHLSEALAEVDRMSETLPTEVPRARAVLKMRAGVIANQRRIQITHTAEAQDGFLPASCVEERDALERVSWHWQRATILMDRANDIPTMQDVYDELRRNLGAIRILNTPIWRLTDGGFPVLDDDGYHVIEWDPDNPPAGNIVVDLTAASPPDLSEGDEVAIDVIQTPHGPPHNTNIWFARVYNRPTDGDNLQRVSLQYVLPDVAFPESSLIRLYARNTCGPSPLPVKVRRKA